MLLVGLLALVAGVLGGAVGAFVGVRAARESAPPAVSASGTAGSSAANLRGAVERVLPAVVTVLADLPAQQLPDGRTSETQNIGSGIVLADSGLVLTNYHVIAGASQLTVVLSTGERRPAVLIADDSPFNDMAILRVPSGGLRAAPLGDSEALRLGDPVAVIASGLLTFENQVKVGVVSATRFDFPRDGVVLLDMLQTDASVNHGDSGGALVNDRGEVVGLVTTVLRATPQGQVIEGVALAHSISSLRQSIDAVLATGVNPRPRLGIERLGTQHTVIEAARLPQGVPGAVGIVAVAAGSPAESAGMRVGDIVVAVNGQPIEDEAPFVNLVGVAATRGDVRLNVVREGRQVQITVTPRVIAAQAPR